MLLTWSHGSEAAAVAGAAARAILGGCNDAPLAWACQCCPVTSVPPETNPDGLAGWRRIGPQVSEGAGDCCVAMHSSHQVDAAVFCRLPHLRQRALQRSHQIECDVRTVFLHLVHRSSGGGVPGPTAPLGTEVSDGRPAPARRWHGRQSSEPLSLRFA